MHIQRFTVVSEICSDNAGLAMVAAACELLQTGTRRIDELWPGDIPDESVIACDANAFSKAQVEFWKLKRAIRALDDLRTSLETKIRPFRRAVIPFSAKYGFRRLPNEVLRNIISLYELSLSSGDDGTIDAYAGTHYAAKECLRKFALVNRQFRDVVYDLPQCYSDIGYGISKPKEDLGHSLRRLSRCKFSNLNVNLQSEVVGLALEMHPEIHSLRVSDAVALFDFRPPTELTNLTSLWLNFPTYDEHLYASPDEPLENVLYELFRPLFTESLKKVSTSHVDLLRYARRNMLTELKIDLFYLNSESSVDELLEFLQSSPLLTELDISIEVELDGIDDMYVVREIDLQSLTCVKMEFLLSGFGGTSDIDHGLPTEGAKWVTILISSIKAPALRSFGLAIDVPERGHDEFWQYFSKQNLLTNDIFPSLRSLNLQIFSSSRKNVGVDGLFYLLTSFLCSTLALCPAIENFTCTFPSARLFTGFNLLAKLKHFHLRCLDNLLDKDIEDTLVAILTQKELNLETIRFSTAATGKSSTFEPAFWNQRLERRMPAHLNILFS